MKNTVLSSVFLFMCITAAATDYYISATGNDQNNGTSPSTSWKTIAKINSRLFSPGDKILFRRGDTWREQLIVPSSGLAGNPITFTAYGSGAKPIINGANIISGWTNSSANVWWINNPNATTTRAMVIIGGVIFSEVSSLTTLNSAAKYFIDVTINPARLYVYSKNNPASLIAEVSTRDYGIVGTDANNIHHVNFDNIEVRYAGYAGLALYGTEGLQFDGFCMVDNCDFYANRLFSCVAYNGHRNNTFKNSKATYNGNGFYSWQSDNLTIKNCSTSHNIHYVAAPNNSDGHGYGGFNADNFLVENCYSDDDSYGINVEGNNINNSAILRYNRIFNSKPGTSGITVGNIAAGAVVQVYYNVIGNCSNAAMEGFYNNGGKVLVYNNTMYNNANTGTEGVVALSHGSNYIFKNNIMMKDGGDFKIMYSVVKPSLPISDYNLYHENNPASSPYQFHYDGIDYAVLTAWTAGVLQDSHSQSGDPLFMNNQSDWALQKSSPCINKGEDVGLVKDILGNPIIGLPDIGAYEYTNVNQPPIANAGNNLVLTLPINNTTLTGSGTDRDGTIASYAWSRVSGPNAFTLGNANTVTSTLSNLVLGTYVFRLTVTDNDGATATDDKTVTVNAAPNIAPTANAGNNIVLTLPTNTITLTGSGTDIDGTIASYAWNRMSGPTTFSLGSANAATSTLSDLVQGTYVFRLTVTDNNGATATDDKTITVNAVPNKAPTADAGNDVLLTLPANTSTLTGSGTDIDGTIVSYAWSRVSGPTTFSLGSANAATSTLSDLVQGTYVFSLTVTDNNGATATDDKTITVNAVPNKAPTADAGNDVLLTLPANTSTLTGIGTDIDGTIVSYAWSRVSGPTTFSLRNANAATSTLSKLVQGKYVFRLTVTDNNGTTASDDKTVTVNAAPNKEPIAMAGNNVTLTLPQNTVTLSAIGSGDPDGTITNYLWEQVSGPSASTFSSTSGAVIIVSKLIEGLYSYKLIVKDNEGAIASATVSVTVKRKLNQAPTANAGSNRAITLPTNTVTLSAAGSADPDGTITSYLWQQDSGPSAGVFSSISAVTVNVNSLKVGVYHFRLIIKDNDNAVATATVSVTVNKALNKPPVAVAGDDQTLNILKNYTTLDGSRSTDPDGVISSYVWQQLSGPGSTEFSSTTTKTVRISNLLAGEYIYQLTVTDNEGATAKTLVNVTLIDHVARLDENLALYPNPTVDMTNVGLLNNFAARVNITVLDISGKKVLPTIIADKPAAPYSIPINVGKLSRGTYLVLISSAGQKTQSGTFFKL